MTSEDKRRPVPPLAKGGRGTVILLVLLALGWWYSTTRTSQEPPVQLGGATMGTTYSVTLLGMPDGTAPEQLQTEIDRILAGVNQRMSTYDPQSELSRFNANDSTDWIDISPELLDVLQEALRISRLTGGAFDVTVGPLVNLWGFGPEMREDRIPSEQSIRQTLARVGHERIHLRSAPPGLKKDRADIYIDLSAIAKGYGVDRVADYLDSLGSTSYLVEIGGELRGKGRNPKQTPWRVAIEKPLPGERTIERIAEIDDGGIATSGDYRNFFVQNGQRYSHALNPRTGWPVRHELASVTVIDETAMAADAMATALMVMGPTAGYALAEAQRLAAMFIIIDGDEFQDKSTSEMQQYLLD
jgi:thiamine biosynthesis lipoprotein